MKQQTPPAPKKKTKRRRFSGDRGDRMPPSLGLWTWRLPATLRSVLCGELFLSPTVPTPGGRRISSRGTNTVSSYPPSSFTDGVPPLRRPDDVTRPPATTDRHPH